MKSLIYPTDFSENASNAFSWAIEIAKINKSKFIYQHVYDPPLATPIDAYTMQVGTISVAEENKQQIISEKIKQIIDRSPVKNMAHEIIVNEGFAPEEIIETAREKDANFIVMGTNGESGQSESILGTVTTDIIRKAPCPVLAIPGDIPFKAPKKIVYATQLNSYESPIFKTMMNFAKLFEASLTFLHIIEKDYEHPYERGYRLALDRFMDKCDYGKIAIMELQYEDVGKGINEYLTKQETDVLGITTHTKSLLDRIMHPSLTKKMVLHTRIPIIAFSEEMIINTLEV